MNEPVVPGTELELSETEEEGHAPTPSRPVAYWTCTPDDERLSDETITEAVEAWADRLISNSEALPETVTVYGFARLLLPLPGPLADSMIAFLLEQLDDEYANPYDGGTDPTPNMRAAMRTAVNEVLRDYEPWACEPVTTLVVRVRDYIDEATEAEVRDVS